MLLFKSHLNAMLLEVADIWLDNKDELSAIDSRFGDGDHGITIGKIALLIKNTLEGWNDQSIKEYIEGLSEGILGINGGSAGPLYGTLIGGLAEPLEEDISIDAATLKKMLEGSRDAMFSISKARKGDKTMMDTLIPAVEAAVASPNDIREIMTNAASAGLEGAEATTEMVSKFGRARSYGEQTLGTRDAGALSTALFFQGLKQGLDNALKH